MTVMIPRNTTIPTKKSEIYSTAADNQTSVEIHVLQGERPMVNGNRSLGRFNLEGIPPASRGVPQIEVTFDIDANGILNVSAVDKATGKEQKITISGSSGLNKDDIEQMVNQAAQTEEEDKKRRAMIDDRNNLDALVYQTEKLIKENKDKVPVADLNELEKAVETAKEVVKTEDHEKIKSAMETLTAANHKAAEAMYKAAAGSDQGGPGAPGAGPQPGADQQADPAQSDDVIDAEFE